MKSRSLIALLLGVLTVLLVATIALADENAEEKKPLDGKELFKNHCKVCHTADADGGEYTPMSLIQDQWDEFFDELWEETHGEVVCPKDETKKVTEMWDAEMLKAVRKFCVDHAADGEQPMTCG